MQAHDVPGIFSGKKEDAMEEHGLPDPLLIIICLRLSHLQDFVDDPHITIIRQTIMDGLTRYKTWIQMSTGLHTNIYILVVFTEKPYSSKSWEHNVIYIPIIT